MAHSSKLGAIEANATVVDPTFLKSAWNLRRNRSGLAKSGTHMSKSGGISALAILVLGRVAVEGLQRSQRHVCDRKIKASSFNFAMEHNFRIAMANSGLRFAESWMALIELGSAPSAE